MKGINVSSLNKTKNRETRNLKQKNIKQKDELRDCHRISPPAYEGDR